MIPEGGSKSKLPNREGYILGSVSMPIFDQSRRMRQGSNRLLVWPLQKYDERFICMGECYKYKRITDIQRNFENNLSITLEMPKFHTDVFYDLGIEITPGMTFKSDEKFKASTKKSED